jgi:hypothetical protein
MPKHSIRFEDQELQDRFVQALAQSGVAFSAGALGAVECSEEQWMAVNAVAHTIRDSCYKWYFSWWDTQELTDRFLAVVRASGLPFQLEHHADRDIFLLSKAYEPQYIELGAQVFDVDSSAS